eukprot:1824755-Rhodomonas_salina.1
MVSLPHGKCPRKDIRQLMNGEKTIVNTLRSSPRDSADDSHAVHLLVSLGLDLVGITVGKLRPAVKHGGRLRRALPVPLSSAVGSCETDLFILCDVNQCTKTLDSQLGRGERQHGCNQGRKQEARAWAEFCEDEKYWNIVRTADWEGRVTLPSSGLVPGS